MAKLHAYILLDRSGSMSYNWAETVDSLNGYVQELKNSDTKARVTVATFDCESVGKPLDFQVIRDSVNIKDWADISSDEVRPRGMTPLYDAIGKITSMAQDKNKEREVIVIITDGHENSSQEYDKDTAKKKLEDCRKKNWQVVHLGADFDAFDQAQNLGTQAGQTINMNAGSYKETLRRTATLSANYSATGEDIQWSDEDRKAAEGKE